MSAEHGTLVTVHVVDFYRNGLHTSTSTTGYDAATARRYCDDFNRAELSAGRFTQARPRRFDTVAPLPADVATGGTA